MAIDRYLTKGRRLLRHQLQAPGLAAVETLTGATQLTGASSQLLKLDPGGAARNVTLPGIDEGVADTDGLVFVITNAADAAENLVILNPAAATVVTISQNESCTIVGTGAQAYAHMGIITIALS